VSVGGSSSSYVWVLRTMIGVVGAPKRVTTFSIHRAVGLLKPATVLAAVSADQFADMWSLAGIDDANVPTARSLAIDGPV
jgi:hypothetical protein